MISICFVCQNKRRRLLSIQLLLSVPSNLVHGRLHCRRVKKTDQINNLVLPSPLKRLIASYGFVGMQTAAPSNDSDFWSVQVST